MLLTIDGCDLSGKTTIARALAKRLKWPLYEHISLTTVKDMNSCGDIMGRIEFELLSKIDWSKNNLIVPRLYASNVIYPIFYKRSRTHEFVEDISRSIEIILHPPWDVIKHRHDSRKESIKLSDLEKIYTLYDDYVWMESYRVSYHPVIVIRPVVSVNKMVDLIIKVLRDFCNVRVQV